MKNYLMPVLLFAACAAWGGPVWKSADPDAQSVVTKLADATELRVDVLAENLFRVRKSWTNCWTESGLNRYGILKADWPRAAFAREGGTVRTAAGELCVDAAQGTLRRISNITFRNFDVSSGKSLRFKSTARQPIGKVTLENFKAAVEKGEPVVAAGIDGLTYKNVTLNGKKQADGPVQAAPGSAAPLVRKPPVTWDCLN